ncbi:ROK family transcriptional regulator [Marinobacterium aestuariivivens]|uniref:ROK family transcriptional regulator n=1 Tax=Marinobacterium aestuariivivens TaxID=1698799 RepID=A0ABW2A5P9_9GAMM
MSDQSNDRSRGDLGQSNRRRVISEILFNGPVPRTEIAARTGLTAASVSRITRDLINAGLVVEAKELPSSRSGRRLVELSLNPGGGYVLGIGINAFAQVVSLADLNNNLIAERALEIECLVDPQPVLTAVAETAQQIIADSGVDHARIFGAGVATAGAVDPARGILLDSQTLGWKDLDIGPRLARMLDLPVALENLPNSINLGKPVSASPRVVRTWWW